MDENNIQEAMFAFKKDAPVEKIIQMPKGALEIVNFLLGLKLKDKDSKKRILCLEKDEVDEIYLLGSYNGIEFRIPTTNFSEAAGGEQNALIFGKKKGKMNFLEIQTFLKAITKKFSAVAAYNSDKSDYYFDCGKMTEDKKMDEVKFYETGLMPKSIEKKLQNLKNFI